MSNTDPFKDAINETKDIAQESVDALRDTVNGTSTGSLKSNLSDAGGYIKQAASEAGSAVKSAASAAGSELKTGADSVKSSLSDGASAGKAAAGDAKVVAKEQMDVLMDKGKEFADVAAEFIKERPIAAFGAAFAAGWLISKLGSGSSDE